MTDGDWIALASLVFTFVFAIFQWRINKNIKKSDDVNKRRIRKLNKSNNKSFIKIAGALATQNKISEDQSILINSVANANMQITAAIGNLDTSFKVFSEKINSNLEGHILYATNAIKIQNGIVKNMEEIVDDDSNTERENLINKFDEI